MLLKFILTLFKLLNTSKETKVFISAVEQTGEELFLELVCDSQTIAELSDFFREKQINKEKISKNDILFETKEDGSQERCWYVLSYDVFSRTGWFMGEMGLKVKLTLIKP